MAWNFQFLDTFAHYTLTEAATKGKWTAAVISLAGASVEDGLQTASVGTQTLKTFTGYASQAAKPQGRIVAIRCSNAFFTSVFRTVCAVTDSVSGDTVALQMQDVTGQLRVINGPATYIKTDTVQQLSITQGQLHNFQLAVWWDGATHYEYEVKVDGIRITSLTVSGGLGPVATGTPGLDQFSMNLALGQVGPQVVHWIWTSQYSNSGGKFLSSDFMANGKRGVQLPSQDGLFAGNVVGALWDPDTGHGNPYFSRINETLASQTQYIKTTSDPNGLPTVLNRASVEMASIPTTITTILAVQRSTLLHAEVGTGTVKLFTRTKGDTNPANTTLDAAITPLSSPTITTKAELVDPRDGAAWTRAKVNSLERGIETQDLT